MKYVKTDLFKSAILKSPSNLYFIFMEDPFERRYFAKKVAKVLNLPFELSSEEELIDSLESPSLFGEKKALICDEIQTKSFETCSENVVIITGKKPPAIYKSLEKSSITLDLTSEKVWDRKDRHKKWLISHAKHSNKTLADDSAAYLTSGPETEFSLLFQELEKAFVYAGDETHITLEMVKAICHLHHAESGWQISESAVWGGSVLTTDLDLYSLVGQLRYQLQLGLQIATGKEAPKGPVKKLEKIRKMNLPRSYYLEGLQELFNLEMKMRSGGGHHQILFDHFRATLSVRRNAISTS